MLHIMVPTWLMLEKKRKKEKTNILRIMLLQLTKCNELGDLIANY